MASVQYVVICDFCGTLGDDESVLSKKFETEVLANNAAMEHNKFGNEHAMKIEKLRARRNRVTTAQ